MSHNFIPPHDFAGNQGNHRNFVPSLVSHKLWLIWIDLKQKNFKMADSKKLSFQPPPKAEQLSPKFHELVLGWVESIDANDIHFTLSVFCSKLSLHRTVWRPHKLSEMDALRINWSYLPKDQFLKFWQQLLSFWWWLKNSVFLSWPFWKKISRIFFFAANLFKLVKVYGIKRMGRNFENYSDYQKNHGEGV